MTLLAVGPSPRWRPAAILDLVQQQVEYVEWPYFCNGSCNSLCVWFYGRVFGSADRMSIYFRLDQVQVRGRRPSCIVLHGHISETVHLVQFIFGSRVKVWEKIMREE